MYWREVEIKGMGHMISIGYEVSIPVSDARHYDFIAYHPVQKEFYRVNVKQSYLRDRSQPNSWSISLASGGWPDNAKEGIVDVYLAYLPDRDEFIHLPGDFFTDVASKSKRIPKEYLQPFALPA